MICAILPLAATDESRGASGFDALVGKLGTHKMSGSCLHIKRLSDVDLKVLGKLIAGSVKARQTRRP